MKSASLSRFFQRTPRGLCLALISLPLLSLPARSFAGTQINLLGDSIVAEQHDPKRPATGWGQFLAKHLQDVTVTNFALSGRSTKTYLLEPTWEKVKTTSAGLWLIQFGHNDSHAPDKPEHTDASGDYKANLEKMIATCRASGATPILVAPPHRGRFGKDGKLSDELAAYVTAIVEVGREEKVPVIDLYSWSAKWFDGLGPQGIKQPFTPLDQTHFNPEAADKIAAEVARQLVVADPALKLAQ